MCGWASRDGAQLPGWCGRCRGRTIADTADLPELWHTLGSLLVPGSHGEQQRVGGSKAPPLPLRLDIANLRGPVTAGPIAGGRDQHGAMSIATTLALARQQIRDVCALPADHRNGETRDTGKRVKRDAGFVLAWADRFAERAEAQLLGDVAGLIHDTRETAWRACGYGAHRIRLGPCPAEIEPGTVCERELWIDPVLDESVRCRDCGTLWDRRHFLWLRRMAEETA